MVEVVTIPTDSSYGIVFILVLLACHHRKEATTHIKRKGLSMEGADTANSQFKKKYIGVNTRATIVVIFALLVLL